MALLSASGLIFGLHAGRSLDHLVDAADIHERLLGQIVVLTVANLFEATNRLGQRCDLALLVRERLGHEERLRQEALDSAGAIHDLLVLFAQFLDAKDRDDVLKLAITLENLLHAASDR